MRKKWPRQNPANSPHRCWHLKKSRTNISDGRHHHSSHWVIKDICGQGENVRTTEKIWFGKTTNVRRIYDLEAHSASEIFPSVHEKHAKRQRVVNVQFFSIAIKCHWLVCWVIGQTVKKTYKCFLRHCFQFSNKRRIKFWMKNLRGGCCLAPLCTWWSP